MRLMQHLEEDTEGLNGYLIAAVILMIAWAIFIAILIIFYLSASPKGPTIRPQQKAMPDQAHQLLDDAGVRVGVQVGEALLFFPALVLAEPLSKQRACEQGSPTNSGEARESNGMPDDGSIPYESDSRGRENTL